MSALSQLFFSIDFPASSVRLATPLITASVGETLAERAGVVNIGLEGMMLGGAFAGALGSYYSGSPWIGLLSGMAAGAVVSLIFAFFAITLAADQVVCGVALNIGLLGATTFLSRTIFGATGKPLVPHFVVWKIPLLSDIPLLGTALFSQLPLVYISWGLVVVAWLIIFRTEWGLKIRAVGEHPRAADSLGISVLRTRYAMEVLCGTLAAMGGTFLSLGQIPMFVEGMTGGKGFIALAVVIVGKWNPVKTGAASLLFGAMDAITLRTQALRIGIPYQLVLMLPYLLTLLVYAGLVGRTRMPGALATPYVKD